MFFPGGHKKEAEAIKMKQLLSMYTVVLLAAFLLAAPGCISAGDKYQELINCDLHQGVCTQNLSGSTVTLAVTPRPVKAMQDLLFQVTFSAKLPPNTNKLPYIDLGMPGMKMGPNRVQLKSAGNDTYEGRGVIVKCPSGRRIWRATVTVPDFGQTDFIFDVIY
jgi:hypothetical protein